MIALPGRLLAFLLTNLRSRVAQAKIPGVTVSASVRSPARGSTTGARRAWNHDGHGSLGSGFGFG